MPYLAIQNYGGMFSALFQGLQMTLLLFFVTLLISIPLGLLVAVGRMSDKSRFVSITAGRYRHPKMFLRWFITGYISIMRGTPLMLQLMFVYFAPYYVFGASYSRLTAAIIAFGINYAAYFAEIFRGGIQSISVGQYEAGYVLGFSKVQTFFIVILPQVFKRILPSLANEVITLVKDTSLAQVIAVVEMFRVAHTFATASSSIIPFFIAGVFYYVMNYVAAFSFDMIEKKMSYYK